MLIEGLDDVRRQIVAEMIELGLEPDYSRRVADVTLHAVSEAMAALMRVCDAVDGPDWVTVTGAALQVLRNACGYAHEVLAKRALESGFDHLGSVTVGGEA